MRRRPEPEPEPIPASHVYRWILDPQGFRTLFGEPSPELLEAVAERRRRQQLSIPVNRRNPY